MNQFNYETTGVKVEVGKPTLVKGGSEQYRSPLLSKPGYLLFKVIHGKHHVLNTLPLTVQVFLVRGLAGNRLAQLKFDISYHCRFDINYTFVQIEVNLEYNASREGGGPRDEKTLALFILE